MQQSPYVQRPRASEVQFIIILNVLYQNIVLSISLASNQKLAPYCRYILVNIQRKSSSHIMASLLHMCVLSAIRRSRHYPGNTPSKFEWQCMS